MTRKNRERGADEKLDRFGRKIIRVAAGNEQTMEAAASSPFLYTRLRALIEAERARREEGETWRALFGVIWRAVPAMALVTILAFVLFLSSGVTRTIGSYSYEALLGERDAGVERVVFASDRQALSSDDVLATILNDEERGDAR
jgi:hypothetical protein